MTKHYLCQRFNENRHPSYRELSLRFLSECFSIWTTWLRTRMWTIMKNYIKLRNTLKNIVFLNSEFWFRILFHLIKLIMSTEEKKKGELPRLKQDLDYSSSSFLLTRARNPSWSTASENQIVQCFAEIIYYSDNRKSLSISPGPPATAQMNKSPEDKVFFATHTSLSNPQHGALHFVFLPTPDSPDIPQNILAMTNMSSCQLKLSTRSQPWPR